MGDETAILSWCQMVFWSGALIWNYQQHFCIYIYTHTRNSSGNRGRWNSGVWDEAAVTDARHRRLRRHRSSYHHRRRRPLLHWTHSDGSQVVYRPSNNKKTCVKIWLCLLAKQMRAAMPPSVRPHAQLETIGGRTEQLSAAVMCVCQLLLFYVYYRFSAKQILSESGS